jgi:hypothetical protein
MTEEDKDAFLSAALVVACLPHIALVAYGFIVGTEPAINPLDWPAWGRALLVAYEAAVAMAVLPFFLK